ncbi:MAG: tetratricopeptide repeat protein, partial [Candidatus Kapabacteria bacterium]|nr:tetratricopeptide repeat protein [Candidatus Kapabacteria bacterium]
MEVEDLKTMYNKSRKFYIDKRYNDVKHLCNNIVSNHTSQEELYDFYKLDIIGSAYDLLGLTYDRQGRMSDSITSFDKAIEIFRTTENFNRLSKTLNNIGNTYKNIADYKTALAYYQESLLLKDMIHSSSGYARTCVNVGMVYNRLMEYEQSITYLKKALDVFLDINDLTNSAKVYLNLGNVYTGKAEYEEALQQYGLCLKLAADINNHELINEVNFNIATTYQRLRRFETARKCYEEMISSEQFEQMENLYMTYGGLLLESGYNNRNLSMGIDYTKKAIEIAHIRSNKFILLLSYQNLSTVYSSISEFKQAYEHYVKYHELEKEVLSEEAKKSAERFHFERTLLEKENEQKLERQRHEAEKEKVQLELQHKEKELETSINQIVEKNNFLQEISSDIQQFVKKHKTTNPEGLEHIVEQIRKHMSQGAVSGMIYDEITSVHGEFMKRIKEQYPDLTDMEVRVSALLRMNLTSANI